MKFEDLPARLQRRLQDPILETTSNDVFMEDIERDGDALIVGCSHAGSDEIVESFALVFDQEQEVFVVKQ